MRGRLDQACPLLGCLCALTLLSQTACYEPDVGRSELGSPIMPGDDAGNATPSRIDGGAASTPDAQDLSLVDAGDASELDAEGKTELDATVVPDPVPEPPAAPAKHAACAMALPMDLPPAPADFTSPVPGPDAYGADTCADAIAVVACSAELACPFSGVCLKTELGDAGICVKTLSCDERALLGQGVPLGYAAGQCVTCVDPAFKLAACCAGVKGVDCRTFPIAGEPLGPPGALCERHQDCEAGLLCAAPSDFRWGKTNGRCLCPGVDAVAVGDHLSCSQESSPAFWASTDAEALASACEPGLGDGWVVERVAKDAASQFAAALGPDGTLHAAIYSDGEAIHSVRSAIGWEREVIPDFYGGFGWALVVDAQGHVHVSEGTSFGGPAQYATNRSGAWVTELVGQDAGANFNRMLVDADGVVHLVYYDEDLSYVHYARRDESGFGDEIVTRERSPELALASVAGELTILHGDQASDGIFRAVRGATGFESRHLTDGESVRSEVSPAGELVLVYRVRGDASLVFARVLGEKVVEEVVWRQDNPRYETYQSPMPDLAFDAQGNPWIAHTIPEGLVLRARSAAGWTTIPIAKQAATPELLVDGAGEPHVFYNVLTRSGYELRHAYRGACPALSLRR